MGRVSETQLQMGKKFNFDLALEGLTFLQDSATHRHHCLVAIAVMLPLLSRSHLFVRYLSVALCDIFTQF